MEFHELIHMAGMGLLTSVAAPLLTLAGRRTVVLRRLVLPAWLTLPAFLGLHAAVTITMGAHEPTPPMHLLLDGLLLAGAIVFWRPVLGAPEQRLDDVGRCVYLFLAAPSLDLPAVVLVARGDAPGGLAMIVAMLPIGLAAVVLTWRALAAEEAAVRRHETTSAGLGPYRPDRRRSARGEVPYAES
jgi:cytochrome c oxidase assembly factor CtaG